MRSDSDSTESRLTLEELVAWNTPQEGSGSVGHDQTLGEGVACDTLEDGRLLYRCQSMTCDRKDHVRRYRELDASGLSFPRQVWVHQSCLRRILDRPQRLETDQFEA